MKASKPIASALWAPLFIRVGLGFYLILLGVWGMITPEFLVEERVQNYAGLTGNFLTLYSIIGPYALVVIGSLLIIGLWTVGAAAATVLLLFPLFYGAGLFEKGVDYVARRSLYKDAVLLCAAVSLLFSGAGMFSFDRFFKCDR